MSTPSDKLSTNSKAIIDSNKSRETKASSEETSGILRSPSSPFPTPKAPPKDTPLTISFKDGNLNFEGHYKRTNFLLPALIGRAFVAGGGGSYTNDICTVFRYVRRSSDGHTMENVPLTAENASLLINYLKEIDFLSSEEAKGAIDIIQASSLHSEVSKLKI